MRYSDRPAWHSLAAGIVTWPTACHSSGASATSTTLAGASAARPCEPTGAASQITGRRSSGEIPGSDIRAVPRSAVRKKPLPEAAPDCAAVGRDQHLAVTVEQQHRAVEWVRRDEAAEVGQGWREQRGALAGRTATNSWAEARERQVGHPAKLILHQCVEPARQILRAIHQRGGLQLLDLGAVWRGSAGRTAR